MENKKLENIKFFFGIGKHSDYIKEYFDKSNIRSSLYVSSVVMLLELLMMINVTLRQFNEETRRTTEWFIIHFTCFAILFVAALALFIYSIRHVKKLSPKRNVFEVLKYVFSIIAIIFGIYISFLDYKKGEQFITLMTMTIFVFCFDDIAV